MSNSKLEAISRLLCNKSDELISALNLNLRKDSRKYSGCCPIHGGDNIGALNLFYEGYTMPGFWKCYTQHCEKIFQPTIIGFVRGVLSQQQGWDSNNDNKVSFGKTIDWCMDFLGQDIDSLKIDYSALEKKKFINLASTLNSEIKMPRNKWSRQEFLEKIDKSEPYFVNRGFSKEVLDKYDVGLSSNPDTNALSHNRVLVPIYDETKQFVVGAQGRSLYKECKKCKLFHNPDDNVCPTIIKNHVKWVNIPERFEISQHFYNIWSAKQYIKQSQAVVLVEGAPNVWRLEEAGIKNSLALCGSNLSDAQQIMLEMLGIHTIYSLPDNDKAGKEWSAQIHERLRRQFKVVTIEIPAEYNDVAEIPIHILKEIMKGYVCL